MPDLNKLNAQVEALTKLVGGFVPLVGAISTIVSLVKVARPSEASQAQEFDAAMTTLANSRASLRTALDDFHRQFPTAAPDGTV